VVVLNLQPGERMNYARTTTGEWLAHCVACCVPEISNAFNRSGIPFHVVSGLLGLEETPAISVANEVTHNHPDARSAWREIEEWARAATVSRTLHYGRMGFLGHTYPGMLDMYSDFTMIEAATGMHVEILEMCDLMKILETVTEEERKEKLRQVEDFFVLSEDSPSDPLAKKPRPEQIDWSCKVAVAQEKLVHEFDLDALTYYYRGADGNEYERLQEAFILGHSLLTGNGIPCSGEGDMKTAVAMKICDTLDVGGSYSEIVATDFVDQTILMGHDGPFHIGISDGKPILRDGPLSRQMGNRRIGGSQSPHGADHQFGNYTNPGGEAPGHLEPGHGHRWGDSQNRQHDDSSAFRKKSCAVHERMVRARPHPPRRDVGGPQHDSVPEGGVVVGYGFRERLLNRFVWVRRTRWTRILFLV
jgi:L-arabinose isomerase